MLRYLDWKGGGAMLLLKDVIREFKPHHRGDEIVVSKVDSKPLNGVKAIVFVLTFSSDRSRIFIALGGDWTEEMAKEAKTYGGATVKRCRADPKYTAFSLTARVYGDESKKQFVEKTFELHDVETYCYNCPETRLIANKQPGQE